MAGYHEEEHLRKLQEEQELLDAPANAECNAETTGECSTRTAQDSTDAGAPLVAAAVAPPLGHQTMASSQDPLMLTPQSLKSHWQTPISTQRTGNSPEVRDSKTRRRWYQEMRRPQGTYLLHCVARELTSLQEILRRRLVRKVPEWDRRPVQILLGNARQQVVGGMSHCTRLSMSTDTH